MNKERRVWFEQQFERIEIQRATQDIQFKEDLDRFIVARTNAANAIKQLLQRDPKSMSAKGLESYVLGLSPIYARLDYIEQLIGQGDYQSAEKELSVLDERIVRVINEMANKQNRLANKIDDSDEVLSP